MRLQAVKLAHDSSGHQGSERTMEILRRRCFWVGKTRDILQHCLSCQRCQFAKAPAVKAHQPLQHLTATYPLEILAMASGGREHVGAHGCFHQVDSSGIKQQKQKVVNVLINESIMKYGAPTQLH
ncbi:hypothetical protein RRG08_053523 [Elysia crispata]|uniref:Integrase zinc-binding domain-containing protein n=1 Tax=Elysia crispata TaxID=231223 RepID=A0AAE0YBC9_9GAST|nr:hypothetical protein RRG08_053523 [Elysia crispata]